MDQITNPQTAERYTVLQAIGEGSTSDIYKARRQSDQHPVALKVFRSRTFDIFENEIKAHELLSQSPNCYRYIVCLYDSFIFQETPILVFELMDSNLNDFEVPANRFISFVGQILEAVAYIHSKNLAHDDLHLGNILYKDGTYKVSDLGFTRRLDSQSYRDDKYSIIGIIENKLPESFPYKQQIETLIDGLLGEWSVQQSLNYFNSFIRK